MVKKLSLAVVAASLMLTAACTGEGPGVPATTWPNPPLTSPAQDPSDPVSAPTITAPRSTTPSTTSSSAPSSPDEPSAQLSPSGTSEVVAAETGSSTFTTPLFDETQSAAWAAFQRYQEVLNQALASPSLDWIGKLQEVAAGDLFIEDSSSLAAMTEANFRQTGFATFSLIGIESGSSEEIIFRTCTDNRAIAGVDANGISIPPPGRLPLEISLVSVSKTGAGWVVVSIKAVGPCD